MHSCTGLSQLSHGQYVMSKVQADRHQNLCSGTISSFFLRKDIRSCIYIADAMRVVRIIPINGLSPSTFTAWAIRVVSYLRSLPGSTLHLVFDDYSSNHDKLYMSKGRPDRGRERIISNLSQPLPKLSDWNDLLTNDFNKFQLMQLLADLILSGESDLGKEAFVPKKRISAHLSRQQVILSQST